MFSNNYEDGRYKSLSNLLFKEGFNANTEAKFLDIHAHINDKAFDGSRDRLYSELADFIVLNAGEEPDEDSGILSEALKHPNFLPCIGLHPNVIAAIGEAKAKGGVDYLAAHLNEAFAVSEVGLDYRGKDESQKLLQGRIFSEILELAELRRKVCIVHSRKSMDELLRIIASFETKIIIHNFEGNQLQYEKAVDRGAYISVSTGFMRFKRDNLIKKIAMDRLFLETDSPALSPDDKMNTPLNIRKLLNYVAALRDMGEVELKEKMWENFQRVFYG